ncbi:MAG: metal-sensitive transcriptional regulator [Chloroflexi bacterium]|nr:metal-sensitive transcriptional regulator [Chloroflexota bacterium]
MQTASAEIKIELARRLNRIEGQVRGVKRMVEDDRECREIVQQLAAIRSAIQQTSVVLLRSYACRCLTEGDEAERERVVDDLMALLGKAA